MRDSLPEGWNPEWETLGATSTTAYYVDEEGIVLGLPEKHVHDNEQTAKENIEFQRNYFESQGGKEPIVVVIFLERTASQDKAARKVYSALPNRDWVLGYALIGGTMLGRAIGSFFLGLARTDVPLRLFGTLAEARPWLRGLREEHRRSR